MKSEEPYDYRKLLRKPEWKKKRAEMLVNSPHCATCGKRGKHLALHHLYYAYGRLPWDYPDDAYKVLCRGCHREADAQRVAAKQDDQRHGWQLVLGKENEPPSKKEIRKIEKYTPEFMGWLQKEGIVRDDHNWGTYPHWYLWNQFSEAFLDSRKKDDPQGLLSF
jgi:hypothetical protein